MKSLIVAAALLLPTTAFAAAHMEKTAAEAPASGLPKCSAKVQDSCDQSMTTEKNALDHYPAETRDAGNNKMSRTTKVKMVKKTTTE